MMRRMAEWLCEAELGDLYGVDRKLFIRCKDCKYCQIHENGYDSLCTKGHDFFTVDCYCSDAERNE